MKNRELLFNELLKMRNSNVSLDEMIVKATHYHLNYYETVNLLHEITKLSVQEISDNLLKDNHWQKLKEKTDEKDNILSEEFEHLKVLRVNKLKKFDKNIEDTYNEILEQRKQKEKKLRNLDKALTELFLH